MDIVSLLIAALSDALAEPAAQSLPDIKVARRALLEAEPENA